MNPFGISESGFTPLHQTIVRTPEIIGSAKIVALTKIVVSCQIGVKVDVLVLIKVVLSNLRLIIGTLLTGFARPRRIIVVVVNDLGVIGGTAC